MRVKVFFILLFFTAIPLTTACKTDKFFFIPSESEGIVRFSTVPLGSFINGSGNGDVLSESTKIVSVPYISMLPYQGVTMFARLPVGFRAKAVTGTTSALGTGNTWKENQEQFDIPSTDMIYRLQICKADGGDLTSDEVAHLVSTGDIALLYERIDPGIVKRNYESEKYVKAACYRLGWENEEHTMYSGLSAMPVFAHISDLHGDAFRFENCVEYANYLGVDAVLDTGDGVLRDSEDGSLYQLDVLQKYRDIPFITCIGNHEVYSELNGHQESVTSQELISRFITPYIEQGHYKKLPTVVPDNAYYYVDFSTKRIRIIVLNQYDNGSYWGAGLGGRLGQEQITWFCNTLLSTPKGYGVIIAMHCPEDMVDTPEDLWYWNQKVTADGRNEDEYGYSADGLYVHSIRPVETIVDAFISKSSLSREYVENTRKGNNGESVSIDVDFGNVAEGVEFICYVTGHRHKDNIGYLHRAKNKQLMLNIVCGNPYYPQGGGLSFSEGCDLPRGDRGITQDAFNVFSVDRKAGCVRVARVGSSVTYEGIERNFLIAAYKD